MRMGVLGVVALGLLTAACGSTEEQRAASGGLTGAGVGALVGGPIGAVAGAVAGGAGGTLLPEGADTIASNAIGKEHQVADSGLKRVGLAEGSSSERSGVMRQAQSELKQQGLYGGPIDGVAGRQTRQAIADYQQQQGLPKTGRLDRQTMARLNGNQNQNQTAQQRNDQDQGIASGSSTPGSTRMSPEQLRSRLQAVGYTNVSNLHQVNDSTYAAQATRGGSTYALQLDAQSGRIVSQQQMGANNPPSNYTAPANARGAGPSGPDDGTNSARSNGSTAQ